MTLIKSAMEQQEENGNKETDIMWIPGMFGKTNIDHFRELVNGKYHVNLTNYWQLYDWSIENYDLFWKEFFQFSGIICSSQYNLVVDKTKNISQIPKWFVGTKLNYAQNIFERSSNQSDSKVALYVAREGSDSVEKITFDQMKNRVSLLVSAMKKMGIKSGDRVVGMLLISILK